MARNFLTKITEYGVPVALEIPLVSWSIKTPTAPTTGKFRFRTRGAWTITEVRAEVGTAASSGDTIVDVHDDATTIFSTQSNRPTIAQSTNGASAAGIDAASIAANSILTMDVDSVGTGAGELTVTVWARRT